jgi:hypothetical protein
MSVNESVATGTSPTVLPGGLTRSGHPTGSWVTLIYTAPFCGIEVYGTCGATHAKFVALFGSPVPLYRATCGYGHSGRVRTLLVSPTTVPVAMILSGAIPVSTQRSNALRMS